MAWNLNYAQMPDFGATMARGQAMAQQRDMNALQMLAQQRQMDNQSRFENALMRPEVMAGLTSPDPTQQQQAYNILAQEGGVQGFQAAMPLIRQSREDAMVRSVLAGVGLGGMPAPAPAAPAAPVQTAALPAAPAAAAGGDTRERNARFAALRQRVMDDPSLTDAQRSDALARISAAQAREGSGLPEGATYRSGTATGFDAGLPAPNGAVPAIGGGAPAAAPAAATPQRPGMPTLAQVSALLASGNQRLVEIGKAYLPIVARDPNYQITDIGGRRVAIDQRNPAARLDLGPSEDVREETRIIDGQEVRGQSVNGRFTPYPERRDPSEREFSRANSLRDEVNNLTKDFRVVQAAHGALREVARDPSPAGDMSLLYQFNKLLDPNSVVRESEFANAARTGSLDQRVGASVLRVLNGERLTQTQRDDFVRQADLLLQSQRRNYDQVINQYRGIAERFRIPVDQVIVDFAGAPSTPAPSAPPAAPQSGVAIPGTGQTAEPPAAPSRPTLRWDAARGQLVPVR